MSVLTRLEAPSKRWLLLIALASCIAMVGIAWAFWKGAHAPRAPPGKLEDLVQRCESDVLRGTCRVQSDPAAAFPADTAVFVAGVGAIDPAAYRSLREAGAALCSTVRDSCNRDWAGARCRAARALHGQL